MSREGIQPQLQERGITVEELIYSNTAVSVYRSTYQGYPAATKVQQVADPENDQIFRECQAMLSLSHENILRMYDFCVLGYYCVIVTEWCNKDVKKDIDHRKVNQYPYTESELWTFLQSMTSALAHMQRSHLAHRDIKPANLFIDHNKKYRVGDFGSSRTQEVVLSAQTIAGTPLYMSPALKLAMGMGNRNAASDPYKSDVYSLGLTLLEMALLKYPKEFAYTTTSDKERTAVITTLPFSEQFKAGLIWMLAHNEEERCSFLDLESWLFSPQLPSPIAHSKSTVSPVVSVQTSNPHQPQPFPFTRSQPFPLARAKTNSSAIQSTTTHTVSPITVQPLNPSSHLLKAATPPQPQAQAPVTNQGSGCCLLW